MDSKTRTCPLCGSNENEPTIAQQKASELGQVIGLAIETDKGEVAIVTNYGRVTWVIVD